MTIAVKITNDDGERRRTVRVRQLEYVKGESGHMETEPTCDIKPGESRTFYIHKLRDLHIEEGDVCAELAP